MGHQYGGWGAGGHWSGDIGAAPNEDSPNPLIIGADDSIYIYACDGVLRGFQ